MLKNESEMKECCFCHIWKKRNEFPFRLHPFRSDMIYGRCKKCTKEYKHFQGVKYKYNVDGSLYADVYALQHGLCAICHFPETRIVNGKICSLAVDHNYKTGCIRALLCSRCNTALGLLQEDKKRVQGMLSYIEKYCQEDESC
jgi:hypothetical protein